MWQPLPTPQLQGSRAWEPPVGSGPASTLCGLIGCSLPQLSMLRISPSMGHTLDMGLALRHLLFLLEYCMVTGYDWWDILLHVQPAMVQSLVDRLHEEYTRQSATLQQVMLGYPPLLHLELSLESEPLGPCLPAMGSGPSP